MGDMGLHGITVAEADGGLGLGYLHHCIAMEVHSCRKASLMSQLRSAEHYFGGLLRF
jgi:alkylation response protein AidB-like acyl-CoA dehydrogenase